MFLQHIPCQTGYPFPAKSATDSKLIGDVVSEATYDWLFVFGDVMSILIFPLFKVGQPEEDPTAYWQAFLFPAKTCFTHEDLLFVLLPEIPQSQKDGSPEIPL